MEVGFQFSEMLQVSYLVQTNVLAPWDGVVKEVLFSVGDVIPGNSKLIELEDQPTD